MNNVEIIVKNNLCNGCCECISLCSNNNICIMFSPKLGHPVPCVADDACISCGECLHSCKQASLLELNLA